MQSNCNKNLLNLEDVKLKSVKHTLDGIVIQIETDPKTQKCPCCGSETSKIHDYRWQ